MDQSSAYFMKAENKAGYTPPKIEDASENFIGVGTRELVIAAAGINMKY